MKLSFGQGGTLQVLHFSNNVKRKTFGNHLVLEFPEFLSEVRAVQISQISYVYPLKLLAFWTSFGCL